MLPRLLAGAALGVLLAGERHAQDAPAAPGAPATGSARSPAPRHVTSSSNPSSRFVAPSCRCRRVEFAAGAGRAACGPGDPLCRGPAPEDAAPASTGPELPGAAGRGELRLGIGGHHGTTGIPPEARSPLSHSRPRLCGIAGKVAWTASSGGMRKCPRGRGFTTSPEMGTCGTHGIPS